MSLNLFRQTLVERRVSLVVMIISLVFYVYSIAAIAESFLGEPEFKKMLEIYPEEILKLFGGGEVNMFTPEGFFGIEIFQLMFPIIVGGYAITVATALIGKEIEQGTIEALLTQPISRLRLLVTRVIALVLVIFILVLVTTASTQLFSSIYDVELKSDGLVALTVLAFSLFVFMGSYGLFFSMIMERGRAIIVSVGVFFIAWIVNSLAEFSEFVEDIQFLSFMKYYKPSEVMVAGEIPWAEVGLFFGRAAVFFIASYLVFRRKNIAI